MSNSEKPKRIRKRRVALQLQEALNAAAALENLEPTELSIARMKLAQTRLNILLQMQARERHDKLKEATERQAELEAENARLRAEVEQLRATVRPVDPVISAALEKYHAESGEHHAGNNKSSSNPNAG